MLTFILLIWLINLADYGAPVAIYLPQSKVLPVFIPIKDNHNNERKGEDSQQQQVNIQSMAGTKDKDSDEDDSNETDQMADTLSDKTKSKLINNDGDSNGDSSDSNGATNSDDDSDGERNKGNLLTSPIQQESTLNEMQTSMMNQLLLGSIGTTLRDVNPLRNPFDEETESSSAYDGNNNESENDKARRLESIMLKGEEDDKDSLLTPSLGSSSSSDGSLSPFPSQDSLDVNEAEISSSSASSSSSPSSPSLSSSTSSSPESTFSAFSSLVDSDNINSLSLRSLIKRLKPFQSAESSSLTSSSSSGSPIMPGSASSLSDAHNHQSIFSQHHLLNLGDANVDSVSSKSMVPLTLTTDLTGSLQQALSSAMSTSSLNSPSLSQSSSSSSSSPNELFNMLSLYQQINDNSMSTAKDDFNLHLFKPLYASNSHSPTFSLSSSSPATSSYRTSSSSSPSSNDHKTRTIILPIMSDSLFQSANPFYEALLQSLSSSSSSSSLPSGSTLKLFQDGFTNTNSELSLDGQSNVGELSSLSGVTGTNEMDDSMHSVTLPDSLVGTSFGVKGHPYVVVDEEFNANGIALPAGYKPDILGILGNVNQQNPPCAGISSPDAQSNNGKSEREKEEYKTEKKPACLLHQPNHYPSPGDQENNRNEDRQPQSHQFHQPREPNRNQNGPDSQTSNDDKDKYHRHRDQDRDQDRDQHRDAQRDQHRDQHRDQYRDQYRDSQQDQYRSQHRNQPQGHHLDDDREPYIPRNRTSFRSIPFIKGAYRYKPDPGYEVV